MSNRQRLLVDQLRSSGFDIVHPFSWMALSDLSRETLNAIVNNEQALCGLLIGNTARAWKPFLSWLHQQSKWRQLEHPFEAYSERIIQTSCAELYADCQIFWAHETKAYVLPIQKIAHESGLAFLSAGQFNIHPQFGPWFALRALVLVATESAPAVKKAYNPCKPSIEIRAARKFQQLRQQTLTPADPHPIQNNWRAWLALRDLYETGKTYRYSEAQIRYHYTHDRSVLEQAGDGTEKAWDSGNR